MAKPKPKDFGDSRFTDIDVDDTCKIEDLLDKNLIIHDYGERTGETGVFFFVKAEIENIPGTVGFSCGGQVVMRKLKKAKEEGWLPLKGKITQPGRYYDLEGGD